MDIDRYDLGRICQIECITNKQMEVESLSFSKIDIEILSQIFFRLCDVSMFVVFDKYL